MPDWRDALRITEPCDADWDELSGSGPFRFCTRCRKNVHDLGALSPGEAARLLGRDDETICVRLAPRPRGRGRRFAKLAAASGLLSLPLAALPARADSTTPPPPKTGGTKSGRRATRPGPRDQAPDELREHVPTAPPRIEPKPDVMGAVRLDLVRPPMARVRECYDRALQLRPDLRGHARLSFTITKGKVERATIESTTFDDPELERCILDVAKSWTFPLAEGTIIVTYPLYFEPIR